MLHKLKQRVETQDAAKYQKLNVNCVCVFCSSVQGMFTSVKVLGWTWRAPACVFVLKAAYILVCRKKGVNKPL